MGDDQVIGAGNANEAGQAQVVEQEDALMNAESDEEEEEERQAEGAVQRQGAGQGEN